MKLIHCLSMVCSSQNHFILPELHNKYAPVSRWPWKVWITLPFTCRPGWVQEAALPLVLISVQFGNTYWGHLTTTRASFPSGTNQRQHMQSWQLSSRLRSIFLSKCMKNTFILREHNTRMHVKGFKHLYSHSCLPDASKHLENESLLVYFVGFYSFTIVVQLFWLLQK